MPCTQGNLAIAQGKQPAFDFEQDRQRSPASVAADLKEADLAHHAERLIVQRFQDSQFFGCPAVEDKSLVAPQLFSVRFHLRSLQSRTQRGGLDVAAPDLPCVSKGHLMLSRCK